MSDAQRTHIDDDVRTLVRLCGYSPDHARAELTAFSNREMAGLIPAPRALYVLANTAPAGQDADTVNSNRARWRAILRG